jgi:glycosyltransferase involved in cell wall biosynthesis
MITIERKILIVMPHYNEANHISETIQSIINQTFNGFELHVFDNDSNDGSFEIISDYALKDSRIKLHKNNTNIGLLGNFKVAYDFVLDSDFEYFIVFQSDDYFHPLYLEVLYENLIISPNAVLSLTNMASIDKYGQLIRYYPDYDRFKIKNKSYRITKYILEPESLGKCNAFMGLVKTDYFRSCYSKTWFTNYAFDYIIAFNLIKYYSPQVDSRVLYFKRNTHIETSLLKNHFYNYYDWISGHYPSFSFTKYLLINYMKSARGIPELLIFSVLFSIKLALTIVMKLILIIIKFPKIAKDGT